jgi:hypothetical protein
VLPVAYYHLVFTLPDRLNPWVQLHPAVIYRLLFQSAWATLKAFAADPRRLGGELGMTAVLHTWGQNLSRHVHLHCLIPGGVLCTDGAWKASRGHYLFPVRALSRYFRGHLVSGLRTARRQGELARIDRPGDVDTTLAALMRTDWVVYSKACVAHTDRVVAYLARYSHRIAISDRRLVAIEDDRVAFRYKDYRDRDRQKLMWLSGVEFVRRFLLHVLPKGFMRLRHYGFLANRCRAEKLRRIRSALAAPPKAPAVVEAAAATGPTAAGYPCPRCRQGVLRVAHCLAPSRRDSG